MSTRLQSAGITVLLLGSMVSAVFSQEAPPANVRVDAVKVETLQERHKALGNLRAAARAQVAALEEGKVEEVLVKEAAVVKKGEVLARIDSRRLNLQLKEAQAEQKRTVAEIAERQFELDNAKRNYERLAPLLKKQMATDKEVKDAQTAMEVAETRLNASQLALEEVTNRIDLLKVRLEDTVITAPFDGRVVERSTEQGEWIRPGDPVMTLISAGTIEAWLEVPERHFQAVYEAIQDNDIVIDYLDKSVQAVRVRVIPQIDPAVRNFSVVADIEAGNGFLVPGLSITSWLPLENKKEYKTIQKDAVLKNETGFYVYAARAGQGGGYAAVPEPVVILFDHQERVIVDSAGLNAGDFVIVEGNERLFPYTPVQFPQAGSVASN